MVGGGINPSKVFRNGGISGDAVGGIDLGGVGTRSFAGDGLGIIGFSTLFLCTISTGLTSSAFLSNSTGLCLIRRSCGRSLMGGFVKLLQVVVAGKRFLVLFSAFRRFLLLSDDSISFDGWATFISGKGDAWGCFSCCLGDTLVIEICGMGDGVRSVFGDLQFLSHRSGVMRVPLDASST